MLWGAWLVSFAVIYSVTIVPHTAYLASLAPAVACLSAAGIVLGWTGYRDRRRSWWVLPLMIATQAGWTLWLSASHPGFLPWLKWLAALMGLVSAVVLVAVAGGRARSRAAGPVTVLVAMTGVFAMLAAPAAWATSVLKPEYSGTAFDAMAGPPPENPT